MIWHVQCTFVTSLQGGTKSACSDMHHARSHILPSSEPCLLNSYTPSRRKHLRRSWRRVCCYNLQKLVSGGTITARIDISHVDDDGLYRAERHLHPAKAYKCIEACVSCSKSIATMHTRSVVHS